jgi:aspartate carbamoyltransferase catalytic subunit
MTESDSCERHEHIICDCQTQSPNEIKTNIFFKISTKTISVFNTATSWFRQLVADLSPWMPQFKPRPVHVGFVVDKVAMG